MNFHDGTVQQCHVSLTAIEAVVQNVYRLTKFYRFIVPAYKALYHGPDMFESER